MSSSVTANFKAAKLLQNSYYQRVCCTRIRCRIAVYGCTDVGFPTVVLAKQSMKNIKGDGQAVQPAVKSTAWNILPYLRSRTSIQMKCHLTCANQILYSILLLPLNLVTAPKLHGFSYDVLSNVEFFFKSAILNIS